MPKLESEIMKQIKNSLDMYKMTGVVEWWERLQSGKVRVGRYFVRMSAKGTPDFVVVLRNRSRNLSLIFIEAKSDTGQVRPDQISFISKYNNGRDIHSIVIRDIRTLDEFINRLGVDKVSELPDRI